LSRGKENKMKVLKIWCIQEIGNLDPTWLVEFEGNLWSSWTAYSLSRKRFLYHLLCRGLRGYTARGHVRKDLIEAVKNGKYKECLICQKP